MPWADTQKKVKKGNNRPATGFFILENVNSIFRFFAETNYCGLGIVFGLLGGCVFWLGFLLIGQGRSLFGQVRADQI